MQKWQKPVLLEGVGDCAMRESSPPRWAGVLLAIDLEVVRKLRSTDAATGDVERLWHQPLQFI